MMRTNISLLACGLVVSILAISARAADPAPPAKAAWVNISDPVITKLMKEGKKLGYPGESAGVAVDPTSGDVYMIVAGLGIWRSSDQGKTFARVDDGKIGGRCETAFALNVDPAGGRLACFMLDGKCAWTGDAGKTWNAFTDVGRNWDYAAVDWSAKEVRSIFAALHESGGQVLVTLDAGKTWTKLFKEAEFDKSGGLGIFDDKTLVYTQKGKGIQRSTDAGQTWAKVSDLEPIGRVVVVRNGIGHWLAKDGMYVSKDKGVTWEKHGTMPDAASIGPMFDPKDEKRIVVAGNKGIHRSADAGQTWEHIAPMPEGLDKLPKAGWFTNIAWDPARDIFYASKMGKPTYKLEAKPAP